MASGESAPTEAGAQARSTRALAEATEADRQWLMRWGRNPPGYGPKAHIPLGNDPSAGSPTETLLRLLLPLNDQV